MSTMEEKLVYIFEKLIEYVESNDDDVNNHFADHVETMLNDMNDMDLFGSERQSDPRGDFRDGDWSIFGSIQGLNDDDSDYEEELSFDV